MAPTPCHLILRFQLLIDTLFLCQLCYEQVEFVSCLSVNVSQIAVQYSAENKIGIEDGRCSFRYCWCFLPHMPIGDVLASSNTKQGI